MLLEIIYFTVVMVAALVCVLAAVLSLVQKPTAAGGTVLVVAVGMVVWSGIYLAQGYGCNT